jgi:hypothetical protein
MLQKREACLHQGTGGMIPISRITCKKFEQKYNKHQQNSMLKTFADNLILHTAAKLH